MEYKLTGLVFLISIFSTVALYGQTDTVVTVTRKGVDARFPYKIFKKPTELKKSDFPLYATDKTNIRRTTSILKAFVDKEIENDQIIIAFAKLDSERVVKETRLNDVINLERKRANNSIQAFDSLMLAYKSLDANLQKCDSLARKKIGFWDSVKKAAPVVVGAFFIGFFVAK